MVKRRQEKLKEEKMMDRQERYRRLLEKLGFAQLVFDFYTAPVE
jgi:hypothetical protein